MSKRRIVVIAVLLGMVVIGGVGAIGLWKYHELPQFCATCHIMDPYLESWQSSDYGAAAHAVEDVTCLDCHEPTVQQQVDELVVYTQGDFEVPLEEREYGNEFCYDCHLPNEHTSYEEVIQLTAGLELNPHDSALGELDCGTCHKMHSSPPWDPDMDCSMCHDVDLYSGSLQDPNLLAYAHAQEGLVCLDCHEPTVLQQVHAGAVPGAPVTQLAVKMDYCFDCHVPNEHTSYEQVIQLTADYMIDDQNINPHDAHPGSEEVGQLECYRCHKMHGESALINGCYGCHHTGTFESCTDCHATTAGGE